MMRSKGFLRFGVLALTILALCAGLSGVAPVLAQTGGPQAEVDAALLDSLDSQGSGDYIIYMAEQADLSAAEAIEDWDARGQYVVDMLSATAEASQAEIKAVLDRQGLRYESFIAVNALYVFGGTHSSVNAVLPLPGVARIAAPQEYSLEKAAVSDAWQAQTPTVRLPAEINDISAWGLVDTHTPQMWDVYGKTGQGVIIASIDGGVMYTHPALFDAYRCKNNPSSPACWFDPFGFDATPYDESVHGTHTMGTMVGSNTASAAVGIAPGAAWIACNACEYTDCYDYGLLACGDWILHPGGNAANRPNVVNNSWGGRVQGDTWFRSMTTAWRAAGIFTVFSAGNSGTDSACSTVNSPGDYPEVFSVAAHNIYGERADFSSNGPAKFTAQPYTKPNLSAPGVDIESTVGDNNYQYHSGTSMAAPHVSGAVALLWSCNSNLRGKIDRTFQILQNSAYPIQSDYSCGISNQANSSYMSGYGYLDVLAAAGLACGSRSVSGVMTDEVTGRGLGGVLIEASQAGVVYARTRTSGDGRYTLGLPEGTYSISYSLKGYQTRATTLDMTTRTRASYNAVLQRSCDRDLSEAFQASQFPGGWEWSETEIHPTVWTVAEGEETPLFDGNEGAYAAINASLDDPTYSQLFTPWLDFRDQNSVVLRFDTDLFYASGIIAQVIVITTRGIYQEYTVWEADADWNGEVQIDVSDQAAHQAEVRFSFSFYSNTKNSHWWIDNVEIGALDDAGACTYADHFTFMPVIKH